MWQHLVQISIVAVYVLVLAAVAFYGFHRYVLVYLYLKHRDDVYQPKGKFAELPKICVQLPMFNEAQVAERIIRSACLIDYPLDRLEIQVLDDSTDDSAQIAEQACKEWADKGYPVKYLHRDNRVGFKAGALAEGMDKTDADLFAIFDADFVAPRDILRNVVDYFYDPKIAMVQVRWDHLNRYASVLTNCQAIFLDGHFVIEHTARNRSGRFMHFNGTAGVWRRQAIVEAGGWQHDTLTEDLDLSYRAQMKGWQFVYLPQLCAPAELPPEIIGFKSQAHRWTKGSVQTAIKLLPGILRSKLPGYIKMEAFYHLTNTLVYPLMVVLTLLMYPVFFGYVDHVEAPLKAHTWGHLLFATGLFILATCSASTFFVFGQRELFGDKAGWKTMLYLPFLMSLGVGIGLNNAKAVIEAIWGALHGREGEFLRTPKYGTTGQAVRRLRRGKVFTFRKLMLPIVEILFGIYMTTCIAISLYYGFGYGTIVFLMIFAGGYFYVGFSSIQCLWQMSRDNVAAEAAPLPTTAAAESLPT